MVEFITGSKEKSQTTRGGMQDQNASSTTAKTLAPIANVGQPNVAVPDRRDNDTIGARTSGAPITPAHGAKSRIAEGGPGKNFGVANPRPSSVPERDGKALGSAVLHEAHTHGRVGK